MHPFRVWAPKAKTVGVKIGNTVHNMEKAAGGWWQADVGGASAGTDYAFVIGGNEPAIPDPRSAWQPRGVHGPSRIVDHASFAWSDDSWQPVPLSSAIIYELHIGTFTPKGTFDVAQRHLPYLKDLGITHVELMPVNAFPGKHGWGYDSVDLFAPHEAYGGPEGLKRFVNACHEHGLAVLLDVVYNHLGPSGNYLAKFGPYFTHLHNTPWGDAVNLEDAGSYEVRRFFCDNAIMWLRDYHFDGLRLDAVHAYMDRSAIHFMEQLSTEVRALEAETGKHYVVIAESDLNDPRLVRSVDAGGYGMDAQWSDDFHHALVTVLTGDRSGYYSDFGSIADLAKSLKSVFVYDGIYAPHRDRIHGRPVEGLPAWRFLGYAQNHDQVGNRAKGERISHLVNPQRAKIAAALVFTAPFVPMLFQGEEWAASSPFQYFAAHEAELGRLVSEGRKKEFAAFGWNPDDIPDSQDEQTFLRSKLNWEEQSQPVHAEMLDWYRKLIALRKSHPELTNGSLEETQVQYSEDEKWLALRRDTIEVVINLGPHPLQRQVPSTSSVLMTSNNQVTLQNGSLILTPDSVAIIALS
ncbi:malto-oligosyltrehalose trehalohydrolase [Alloacidobacterium dinghuense]|uniref:Malto-oligosyltrehalose trehalohydrolase n=1 Tax=Alloacidobacterium dinghuense TaxID=2763107 RepID=A0A7G8BIF3_9BACT|nr:malto-oligosyltrehalose trehalohydrolase [Alloacidobacterium dinghuense]QNI32323.1 malto-oligosyltrehalose trehalohydrolase [Alloacidobacterium dinghuense]